MRLIALALLLAACGPTNPNQDNYDRARAKARAELGLDDQDHHGDAAHGDASAASDDHDDEADDHGDGDEEVVAAADGQPDIAAGEKVYKQYCQACHGADGQGMNGLAANFVADPSRLAKTDAELVKSVREGYSGNVGVMPPWGSVVDEPSAYNAIAYIRDQWGE